MDVGRRWQVLFDPDVTDALESLADGFGIEPADVIEHMIIRRLAEDRARVDVYGGSPALLMEFTMHDDKRLDDRDLYHMLYNVHRERLERDYCEQLLQQEQEGVILDDHELALMIRRGLRAGPEPEVSE